MRKRIDWSIIDLLITQHLPHLTCADFCDKHADDVAARTIGARAKKLGVKFAPRIISAKQRAAIGAAVDWAVVSH